jgi:hypothetical protein
METVNRLSHSDTPKTDEKTNFHIEHGGPVHGRSGTSKVVLQVNKRAKNTACKNLIKKYGAHHVVATAEVGEDDKDLIAVINALAQNAFDNNLEYQKMRTSNNLVPYLSVTDFQFKLYPRNMLKNK